MLSTSLLQILYPHLPVEHALFCDGILGNISSAQALPREYVSLVACKAAHSTQHGPQLPCLQQSVQHIWEGALHKEGIALEHKLDFAIVACAGLHKLPNFCWQSHLLSNTPCLRCYGKG